MRSLVTPTAEQESAHLVTLPEPARQLDIDPALPPAVRERVPIANELAMRKMGGLRKPAPNMGLLRAAQSARTAEQRIVWLHRFVDSVMLPIAEVAPCRAGCVSCCHVAVPISSIEAKLLARVSGRAVRDPDDAVPVQSMVGEEGPARMATQADAHIGVPCPFLKDQRCSVYEHRPNACRTHFSLDVDDLLCRLIPGASVPLPLADTRPLQVMILSAQPTAVLADIRDFFAQAGP